MASSLFASTSGREMDLKFTGLRAVSSRFREEVCSMKQVGSVEEFQKLKKRLEKSIPKMYRPDVSITSFVGMEEVKEDLLEGVRRSGNGKRTLDSMLLFGANGSGKSHFARALGSRLGALLFSVDKTIFHGWSNNLHLFTQVFAAIAGEQCAETGNRSGYVVLLLENFDWFYDDAENDVDSSVKMLNSLPTCWAKYSSLKLMVVACSYMPWALEEAVIDCFQRRVYLRPLDFQERKQLIKKKSADLLPQWGLDMTEQELREVVKRAEKLVGWEVCETVEKVYRLQCPPHGHRPVLRPFNKVDFDVIFDRMLTRKNEREIVSKFEEFNRTFGDGGKVRTKGVVNFEDKGVQVDMKRGKRNGTSLSKLFGRITI